MPNLAAVPGRLCVLSGDLLRGGELVGPGQRSWPPAAFAVEDHSLAAGVDLDDSHGRRVPESSDAIGGSS